MNSSDQEDVLIEELRFSGINEKILRAIKAIKREFFVLEEDKNRSYENVALPLIFGSTISQPYTVAIMLQELELKKGLKVLEVGTGSGWNAALISYLVGKNGEVYSTEIIKEMVEIARKNLKKAKRKNVKLFFGNILKEKLFNVNKFDRIIVTAAAYEIPKKLIKMLKDDGILICPVGEEVQELVKIKKKNGRLIKKSLGEFIFVRLKTA